MSESLIQIERDAGVVTLSFHDPERRNAMTRAMGEAFSREIAALRREPDLRAVVLTGAGRAFSAGGDLGMLEELATTGAAQRGLADREIRDTMRSFYGLFLSVRELACPSVAAINGHAIGAGLCVALACDLRVAARDAKLGLNFTKLAIHPGMGATWTLPRLVGSARAAELLYTSRLFSGEEAQAMGLVSQALAAEAVLPAAQALGREIAECSPIAVSGLKQALARSAGATLEDQLSFEAAEQATCFQSEDVHEGLAAARERRAPRFQGR
ncbi:MAG: enoyl-CoA hydratase/isomerase family protein [Thermoleophilia bacterium]|nr:enoyl-CoA hydratase/isomerase family protein [Thermoleophilia bacterium]